MTLSYNTSSAHYFRSIDPMLTDLFGDDDTLVWDAVGTLSNHLAKLLDGKRIIDAAIPEGTYIGDGPLYISRDARIEPGCHIAGACYIASGATMRHGSYVREDVILLPGSVLGHASEAKNSIFMQDAKAPHFAYVGDSILGARVNLGAGSKLSNLPITSRRDPATGARAAIKVGYGSREYDTGLSKLGAILGDDVELGCNAVLSPGTIIGPRSLIYPNMTMAKGIYDGDTVYKLRQITESARRM